MSSGPAGPGLPGRSGRTCFFIQAGFGTAFTYLTSGVFLSGLAILMGAGDILVSYLSVIVNICGVLILAFPAFLERFTSRKKLTIALTILSRLATLFIVTIPVLFPAGIRLYVFVPTVVAAFALQAQTTVVLNQWMLGFIEEKKSGRYISLRQTLTLTVTVVLSLAGGRFMDLMEGKYAGFALLFAAAALMGLLEVILLAATPDGEPYQSSGRSCRFLDIARLPLKNRCFTGFVAYIFIFYLLLTISDSYTMVFMMKYLALPYQIVTGLYMMISLPQIILLSFWGRLSDRYGHEFTLKMSIWFFAGETLFLSFASAQNWFIFIPAAFLISSAANAGFVISVFNRRYELMPEDNRIVYDNFYTAAIGLGSILGPLTGGAVKGMIDARTAAAGTAGFTGIRILYLISTTGILLLQFIYFYSRKETNHVKD
ncbi:MULTISPECIES: MFS transporter [Hungatella]|uniref:MFS transporter n=1 Tax=Hungatella hathewayi TaxID=154046 RepID=A0AAW9WDQ1_9FIRM|nr:MULTISPECIES: MFS transporter [Hungatella]MCQ4829238.1 MFS transporter [Hungatella sp. SL.1.14]MUB63334.1 MFS transporter [Hungatella hathewayi]CUQ14114.1 major facilitator superfamily protein [Hungatella hathewayi]